MVPALFAILSQATPTLTIDPNKVLHNVSPDLYGIFFEEINQAGDGGLYGELIRNGRFSDSNAPDHWKSIGGSKMTLSSEDDPRVLIVEGSAGCGVQNDGYWGIAVEKGQSYQLKFRANSTVDLLVSLVDSDGTELCKTLLNADDRKGLLAYATNKTDPIPTVQLSLVPNRTARRASLRISLNETGNVELFDVSLFPAKTWKNRPNGLRPDLAQKLDDLKPAFVRFPGGCWVEGDTCATSLRWKQTIGPVHLRRTQANLWNYSSGNGLGFHEYLQLCEDLGAKALFVINCGMSHREVIPMDKMDEYVQDALDAVEYANGPVSSKWGAERAKNGHPKPFNLRYMEIGNENGGTEYAKRYPLFVNALNQKYPDVKLITNVWGGVPTTAKVEIVDEHYYSDPNFFIQNADKYDTYDRKGPKVYVGEYAVTNGVGNGNVMGAVAEAAFMTGMERNSDIVVMSSYAPLFANVNNKAWNPDLIYFDNHRVAGTPSYYVQQLFSCNRPDQIVASTLVAPPSKAKPFPAGGIGIGTWGTQAEFKDISLVQDGKSVFTSPDGSGLRVESGRWEKADGAIRQTTGETPTRAWIGDAALSHYTLTLKAKKISGDEGFLVTVGRQDEKNYLWFNLGGWGNTVSAIEYAKNGGKSLVGKQKPGKIETGRWYDIKIDYSPDRIVCWLDGAKIYDETVPQQKSLFAVAGKTRAGEVIVKVVNASDAAHKFDLQIGQLSGVAVIQDLFSPMAESENTLDEPNKVVPRTRSLRFEKGRARYTFPAHSVTVLRLK